MGFTTSPLCSWGKDIIKRSEGESFVVQQLNCVAYMMRQCTVLLKTKLLFATCLVLW